MTIDFQAAKGIVRSYYQDLAGADQATVGRILGAHVTPDYRWRDVHPFNELEGVEAVANSFWTPFLSAFAPVQRRTDVFLAGINEAQNDGTVWVMSMGHLLGPFDRPWLGIPPTRKIAMLRFAEFHRVKEGHGRNSHVLRYSARDAPSEPHPTPPANRGAVSPARSRDA